MLTGRSCEQQCHRQCVAWIDIYMLHISPQCGRQASGRPPQLISYIFFGLPKLRCYLWLILLPSYFAEELHDGVVFHGQNTPDLLTNSIFQPVWWAGLNNSNRLDREFFQLGTINEALKRIFTVWFLVCVGHSLQCRLRWLRRNWRTSDWTQSTWRGDNSVAVGEYLSLVIEHDKFFIASTSAGFHYSKNGRCVKYKLLLRGTYRNGIMENLVQRRWSLGKV